MIDYDECGAVGGIKIGRGNRNTQRNPAPVPLCPPQIPHYLTWALTRAAAVGGQLLTASKCMCREPFFSLHILEYFSLVQGLYRSRDSIVGIATGQGLDDREIGVRVPVGSRIFSSHHLPDPTSFPMGTGDCLPVGKAAGA
jgi:hypothetical protein